MWRPQDDDLDDDSLETLPEAAGNGGGGGGGAQATAPPAQGPVSASAKAAAATLGIQAIESSASMPLKGGLISSTDTYLKSGTMSSSSSSTPPLPGVLPPDSYAVNMPKNDPAADIRSKFFFIVACHNSAAKIRATVEHLLKHVPPRQIVIADNGSTPYVRHPEAGGRRAQPATHPFTLTKAVRLASTHRKQIKASRKLCEKISEEYKAKHPEYRSTGVNYGHISEGASRLRSRPLPRVSVLTVCARPGAISCTIR